MIRYQRIVLRALVGALLVLALPGAVGRATSDARVALPVVAKARVGSSQALIEAARKAGTIDYATSLLYRAYATFGDERLPTSLVGDGPVRDATLLHELASPVQPLSDAQQALLLPFRVRPGAPGSIFNPPATASQLKAGTCTQGWTSVSSTHYPVKVWATCRPGNASSQQSAITDATGVVALIDDLWTPMVGFMGEPPLADNGGTSAAAGDVANDDTKSDIYLLPTATSIRRDGQNGAIPNDALAASMGCTPFDGVTSSGYMMLPRADIAESGFKSSLAHEFFHVLQFHYNERIQFQNGQEFWFVEASATWAESYFVPTTAADEVHSRFADVFQQSDLSLHTPASKEEPDHAYAAYIWPFFMQQEANSPAPIVSAWQTLGSLSSLDWEQANAAISAQLSFEANFRRFAIRNANQTFDGENPIGTRYVALDSTFPDGVAPADLDGFDQLNPAAAPAVAYQETMSIPSLVARYRPFRVADSIGKLVFDFSGLAPATDLNIDALVKIRGRPWAQRELTGSSKLTFCRDRDPVEQVILIVSNHNPILSRNVVGPLKVTAMREQCTCQVLGLVKDGWRGRINVAFAQDLTRTRPFSNGTRTEHLTVDRSAAVNLDLTDQVYQQDEGRLRWSFDTFSSDKPIDGSVVLNDRRDDTTTDPPSAVTYTQVGGPLVSAGRVELDFDLKACTYDLKASLSTQSVYSDGKTTRNEEVLLVSFAFEDQPLPADIEGGWSVSGAHSLPYDPEFDVKQITGYTSGGSISGGMGGYGTVAPANLSFSFSAITPPQ